MPQLGSKGSLLAEFPLPQGPSVFFLLKLSADWLRLPHMWTGNLLYSKPTDLNVNLI